MRRLALVLVSVLLAACSAAIPAPATPTRAPLLPTSGSTAEPTRPPVQVLPSSTPQTPTAEPLATPEPTSTIAPNKFVDDFSDPKSGWDVSTGAEGSVGYENGEYVIQVDKVDFSLWANPGRKFDDVLVGVTAQPADNSATADMGAICRYQDVDNFIYGGITSDGFYGISQVKKGDLNILTGGGKLQRSDVIHQNGASNQIQILCAGNRFTLVVNGQSVAEITADAPASGDVGLIAGTFEKPGARVRFDNFSAALPSNTEVSGIQSSSKAQFTDDFSDPKSGWDVRETDNGATGYQDGRYFIRVDKPKYQLWSTPGRSVDGDVMVKVTAGLARGPQQNEMGVICRYQDRKNFIYGSIGTDGYYAIVEIKDDAETILTGSGKFQKSDAIPVGSETYVIRLACEGDRYTLFVNDQQIDSASSSAFSGGDVGLLAGTFDQGGVEVLFDDFSVSAP